MTKCVYLQVGFSDSERKVLQVLPIHVGEMGADMSSPYEMEFAELQPLEEDFIDFIATADTADLVEAMCDFAEWDDHARVSVRWPTFLINLLMQPALLREWKERAEAHDLAPRFPTRAKLFLFFLCCEHIGAINLIETHRKVCNTLIFSPRYQELLDSVLFFSDNQHRDYQRNFSRYGEEYQALIPDLVNFSTASADVNAASETIENREHDIIFKNETLVDDDLVQYISSAKKKVMDTLLYRPGVLLQTVRNANTLYSSVSNTLELPSSGDDWRVLCRRKVLSLCVLQSVDPPQPVAIMGSNLSMDNGDKQAKARILSSSESQHGPMLVSADKDLCALSDREDTAIDFRRSRDSSFDSSDPPQLLDTGLMSENQTVQSNNLMWNKVHPEVVPSLEAKGHVSDGYQRWSIPFSMVRVHSTEFETTALSFLHIHAYNIKLALHSINNLTDMKPPHSDSDLRVRPTHFDAIISVCAKSEDDMFSIFGEVSQKAVKAHPGDTVGPLSMKKLVNVYYSKYHDREWDKKETLEFDFAAGGSLHSRLSLESLSSRKRSRDQDSRFGESKVVNVNAGSRKRAKDSPGFTKWPAGLPIMRNNLYWIKNSETPCVCLGLELPLSNLGGRQSGSGSGTTRESSLTYIKIFPINCNAPMRQVSVLPSTIEPLDVNVLTHCHDTRTVDFTLAMMKFAEWEMDSNPVIGSRWYSYPSFIMRFLAQSHEWSTWRKQVLRSAKGKMSVPKWTLFFESLVSDYENFYRMTDYNRCIDADVPWNDSWGSLDLPDAITGNSGQILEFQSPSISTSPESVDINIDVTNCVDEVKSREAVDVKSTKKSKTPKVKDDKLLKESKYSKKKSPGLIRKPINRSSLYWLTRHSLPCLRLPDDPVPMAIKSDNKFQDPLKERDPEENFRGQPICCTTYHYEVQVTGAVEELTQENLKNCNDERTIDFTNALLDFQKWDIDRHDKFVCTNAESELQDKETPEDLPNLYSSSILRGDDAFHAGILTEYNATTDIDAFLERDAGRCSKSCFDSTSRYVWPAFILDLITHPPEWAIWRKRCERLVSVNQKRDGRRDQYFKALKEEQVRLDQEIEEHAESRIGYRSPKLSNGSADTENHRLFDFAKDILDVASGRSKCSVRPDSLQALCKLKK